MVAIYQGAAAADREAARRSSGRRWAEGGRRWIVYGMEETLREDPNVRRAAAILRALCRPDVYRELVKESGLSPDEYEAWLSETLKEQLLP